PTTGPAHLRSRPATVAVPELPEGPPERGPSTTGCASSCVMHSELPWHVDSESLLSYTKARLAAGLRRPGPGRPDSNRAQAQEPCRSAGPPCGNVTRSVR